MGIKTVGKKQHSRIDHRVLAREFIVRVWYIESELAQSPDDIQYMLHDLENRWLFAELMYDTMRSKLQCKIDVSPDDDQKAPYGPPDRLSPNEDAELQRQLEQAICNGLRRLIRRP